MSSAGGEKGCVATFSPNSDSVRHVQFDPFNAQLFAAGFENGTLQV